MGRATRRYLLMARANRLANHRLHEACLELTHAEWVAPRVAFFPSIAATLHHVLVVDRYYLDALNGEGAGRRLFAEPPCATMPELAAAQIAADGRWIDFCLRLDAAGDEALDRQITLDRGARGRPAERIDRTLDHLFMHATHHRGQVHALLSDTPVAPPQLDDFLMATDAASRADDLAAVGMTEADLAP